MRLLAFVVIGHRGVQAELLWLEKFRKSVFHVNTLLNKVDDELLVNISTVFLFVFSDQ